MKPVVLILNIMIAAGMLAQAGDRPNVHIVEVSHVGSQSLPFDERVLGHRLHISTRLLPFEFEFNGFFCPILGRFVDLIGSCVASRLASELSNS